MGISYGFMYSARSQNRLLCMGQFTGSYAWVLIPIIQSDSNGLEKVLVVPPFCVQQHNPAHT